MHSRSILLAFILVACSSLWAAPLNVIIDPGHGGKDDGATRNGINESDITLKVSQILFNLLKKDRRFQPHLTRDANTSVSLLERAQIAKDKNADLFLSIHVNSNPDPKARGAEFYFQNQLPPDEESMLLAHRENSDDNENGQIQYDFIEKNKYPPDVTSIVSDLLDNDRILRSSQLSKSLKISWRGTKKSKSNSIRQAPFFVLTSLTTPSSLVELGFITNNHDLTDLNNPGRQQQMAEDLYRGLIAYKESMDKPKTAP